MVDLFSFSERPIISLLGRITAILPGIEKVTAVYFDPSKEKLFSSSMIKSDTVFYGESAPISDPYRSLDKYRTDIIPYSWIRKEDVDFEISHKEKVQLNIFNELDNNILLIRIHNNHDNLSDLIFIYFNKNLSNFGIANDDSILSTANKSIIGYLIRNTVETFLHTMMNDREIFVSLLEHQNQVISDLQRMKKELIIARSREKNALVQVCRSHLEDLARESGVHFNLSEDSIAKIREFDGDAGQIKVIIAKAARFARSVNIKENGDEVIIESHHIIFTLPEIKHEDDVQIRTMEETPEVPARYARTFNFLNKLETAAQSVKGKNMLLTSVNVGSAFPSPITPAAITDALKNHKSKIIYLFKELPQHWQTIRTEFRPVQNILNPRPERQKRTG